MIKTSIVISLLLISSSAWAYQFEDYRWGDSLDYINEKITKDGKTNIEREKDTLRFDDTIYDKPCRIIMLFTPKTKQLGHITVRWNPPGPGKVLKRELTAQYGPPNDSDSFLQQYTWRENMYDSDNMLILNCSPDNPVKVQYFGGEYWRKMQGEKR
jgi:hypothetical protein